MSSWDYGYFTESTYTYGYYRDISPAWQNFCLTANGFKVNAPDENSAHCELGYGQGVSINIHAAVTPGKYFGTDFNPSHAAHANELCKAAGSDAKFFDDSFEEMLNRDDLPKFDSISLHGIWSWISEENQSCIVKFARKFLKPGGIFYNSYNCYPGWSPAAPMRELFILYDKYTHNGTGGGGTRKRIGEALKFTEELLNKNPLYFRRVPDIKNIFEGVKKHNHNYLAHEYFNRDWICMYFSEVAEMMQSAKLDYACTTDLVESLSQFNFPKDISDFLNKFENPIMKEQLKDYFISRQFRKDIYIRGARKLSDFERVKALLETNYILMTKNDLPKKYGQINLPESLVEKIQAHLSAENYRPKNFAEFVKKNRDISWNDLATLLILLVQSGNVMPCQSEKTVQSVKKICVNLNKYICKRAEAADEVMFLASPVLGTGCPLNKMERIFLSAEYEGKKSVDDVANYLWKIFSEQGQRLVRNNKPVESDEENIAALKNMAQNFTDNNLPILKLLQII